MNVVIFGATGMVGSGVLLECLEDARAGAGAGGGTPPRRP